MKFKSALLISLIFITLFWPILFGLGITLGLIALANSVSTETEYALYEYHWGQETSTNQILSIPIYGPILDERPDLNSFDPFLSVFATYGTSIKEILFEAADNNEVVAVILEINSPGGTVTGSKAIADGVSYFKEVTGKPVYAHANGLMASGAYWAAANADQINAETGSLIGSIGVIGGQFVTYNNVVELNQGLFGQGVTTTDGIDVTTITAGEGKDFGNPFRAPTEKELQIAQESAEDAYETFVNYVSTHRNLTASELTNNIGAYVYGEKQAWNLKLIDGIASREAVYIALAEQAGIGNDFQIVRYYEEDGFFTSLLRASTNVSENLKSQSKQLPKSCLYAQRVMAYHGNVTELCL